MSRTALTLCFQLVVHQAAGMQLYLHEQAQLMRKLHLRTMKIGKRYSVGRSPKISAHTVEWRRVLSLARSMGAYCEAACVYIIGERELVV